MFKSITSLLLFVFTLPSLAADQPNIVLIMADDLGAETLACYGAQWHTTPNLDRMAAQGARFTNAYATPICTPTRAMILTGLLPNRTGFLERLDSPQDTEDINRLPAHIPTFASLFKQAGYATAIAGKWHLGNFNTYPDQPTQHGFDTYSLWTQYWHGKRLSRYYSPDIYENKVHTLHPKTTFGPDHFANFLLNFIERSHKKNKPFLAYFPMNLIHGPIIEPPALKELVATKFTPDMNDKQRNVAHMITYMDHIVGKFIKKTKQLGIEDNTLIIFTGDNGTGGHISQLQGFGQIRGMKGRLVEAGQRIPFIARWPGKIPSGTRDSLLSLVDILPTLASIANIPVTTQTDGHDLTHNLYNQPGADRQYIYTAFEGGLFSIRDKTHRLHQNGDLYHIPTTTNATRYSESKVPTAEQPAARKRLQQKLDALMAIQKTDTTYTVIPFGSSKNELGLGKK
jgi:arylsulfatase A